MGIDQTRIFVDLLLGVYFVAWVSRQLNVSMMIIDVSTGEGSDESYRGIIGRLNTHERSFITGKISGFPFDS